MSKILSGRVEFSKEQSELISEFIEEAEKETAKAIFEELDDLKQDLMGYDVDTLVFYDDILKLKKKYLGDKK